MPTKKIQRLLHEINKHLKPKYGKRLKGVVLYGSEARGESNPESDIDVLVLLDDKVNYGKDLLKNISLLYPLSQKLGRRISPKPVSEEEYDKVQCPLYLNAHLEGVRI